MLLEKAAIDGLGLVMTFEGYVHEAVTCGVLVSVLDDWCAPFPKPFSILSEPAPAATCTQAPSSRLSRNGENSRSEAGRALSKKTSQHARQHAVRRLVVVEEGLDIDDHLLAHLDAALDGGGAHVRQQHDLPGLGEPH